MIYLLQGQEQMLQGERRVRSTLQAQVVVGVANRAQNAAN